MATIAPRQRWRIAGDQPRLTAAAYKLIAAVYLGALEPNVVLQEVRSTIERLRHALESIDDRRQT